MNIVFLDYDGVVNTLMFDGEKEAPYFNFPEDNKVNNYQAVCWLNKLCKEYDMKIVVTSTWRVYDNYKECLYNGGLDKSIEILGRTKKLGTARGIEIQEWLDEHKELNIEKFVIFDDDSDMAHLEPYLVKTDTYIGITYHSYNWAEIILKGSFDKWKENTI